VCFATYVGGLSGRPLDDTGDAAGVENSGVLGSTRGVAGYPLSEGLLTASFSGSRARTGRASVCVEDVGPGATG
jgi:hypothetical protein